MHLVADLHIHSRFSMATSKKLDFVALYRSAALKGIGLVGTGDFTHPGWMAEIERQLVEAEPGLFSLAPDLERAVRATLPPACQGPVRFVLQVEISNIYKRDGKTRKNHNLVFVPTLEAARSFAQRLSAIGNVASDGRPILGLDARDLLEIVLETHPEAFLIPAHIWTPWFSALGSKSGFDHIDDCFGDLAHHVFAAETGLSSDPAMNWRVSWLDRLTLVSNSDAHSPDNLGREANLLDIELGFSPLLAALRDRTGYLGTLEFYPDEGKYHLDGHRKCQVRWTPKETLRHGGTCPVCGQPVTVGVLHRVESLADRPEGYAPDTPYRHAHIVPLAEVVAEVLGQTPKTKAVAALVSRLHHRIGPELFTLTQAPLEDIAQVGGPVLAEAISRVRSETVSVTGGFDGEFGVVRVFAPDERNDVAGQLFLMPAGAARPKDRADAPPAPRPQGPRADGWLDAPPVPEAPVDEEAAALGVDADQWGAVRRLDAPMAVTAGPGTGKTRTLVAKIRHAVSRGIDPQRVVAVTFTNQAVAELRERLSEAPQVGVYTFHALGRTLLSRWWDEPVAVADDAQRRTAMEAAVAGTDVGVESALEAVSAAKQHAEPLRHLDTEWHGVFRRYTEELRAARLLDVDDLVLRAVEAMAADDRLKSQARALFSMVCVDEYQDVNEVQAAMIRALCPTGRRLTVIGDPDQAIYGFRGAQPGHFLRFGQSFPEAVGVALGTTYRLTEPVLRTAKGILRSQGALRAVRGGVPVEVLSCPTAASEAEQVVVRIEQLVGGTSLFALDSGRGGSGKLGFGDVAILVRTKFQREEILEALGRSGIPALAVGDDEPHDPRSEKVAVMTMHASKGREFPAVFVCGVQEGLLPLALPGLDSDPEEERRLLYVAVTRAKEYCAVSFARRRSVFGIRLSGEPSPFVRDLPAEAVRWTRISLPRRVQQLSLW